ncbi:MAG: hypothetical protein A2X94_11975 [Bdellovibrionales bacterium GWB1_55_8]|nr:MAG: hypothetical protein A2X94_11975 [Bdellovibrionales bacterium GWB1_55_8]
MNRWILVGAASGFFTVAFGAFGAHALSQHLSQKGLQIYQTAVQYQMFHSLALIGFGLWASQNSTIQGFPALAGWFFASGILLFSGSLYALAITEIRTLGMITPIGGLFFLAGWIAFGAGAWISGKSGT